MTQCKLTPYTCTGIYDWIVFYKDDSGGEAACSRAAQDHAALGRTLAGHAQSAAHRRQQEVTAAGSGGKKGHEQRQPDQGREDGHY